MLGRALDNALGQWAGMQVYLQDIIERLPRDSSSDTEALRAMLPANWVAADRKPRKDAPAAKPTPPDDKSSGVSSKVKAQVKRPDAIGSNSIDSASNRSLCEPPRRPAIGQMHGR